MKALERRVSAMETGNTDLSPALKQWLGWPLTEAELKVLDMPADPKPIDTRGLSKEARAWLGID